MITVSLIPDPYTRDNANCNESKIIYVIQCIFVQNFIFIFSLYIFINYYNQRI